MSRLHQRYFFKVSLHPVHCKRMAADTGDAKKVKNSLTTKKSLAAKKLTGRQQATSPPGRAKPPSHAHGREGPHESQTFLTRVFHANKKRVIHSPALGVKDGQYQLPTLLAVLQKTNILKCQNQDIRQFQDQHFSNFQNILAIA